MIQQDPIMDSVPQEDPTPTNSSNVTAIIATVTVISIAVVGAVAWFRKKKEDAAELAVWTEEQGPKSNPNDSSAA